MTKMSFLKNDATVSQQKNNHFGEPKKKAFLTVR